MINIYILGINGKMGKVLQSLILDSENFQLETSISDPIDAIIDFSSPNGLLKGLSLALELNIPFVSGTTGLTDEHFESLHQASHNIPVLHSSNFSIGIYFIKRFLKALSGSMPSFFVDIFESHHLSKKDSPSGTTLDLLKICSSKVNSHQNSQTRSKKDLHIHPHRTPYFSCDHSVELSNEEETLSIKHSSKSRAVYAKGALLATEWLLRQDNGFYTIENVYKENLFNESAFSSV